MSTKKDKKEEEVNNSEVENQKEVNQEGKEEVSSETSVKKRLKKNYFRQKKINFYVYLQNLKIIKNVLLKNVSNYLKQHLKN